MLKRYVVAGFDYGAIPNRRDRESMRDAAEAVRLHLEMTTENLIEVGRRLIEVRKQVGRQAFLIWLRAEFPMPVSQAFVYMRVAEHFGGLLCKGRFEHAALLVLGQKTVPCEAVQEAIRRSADGEYITRPEAVEIVSRHASGV